MNALSRSTAISALVLASLAPGFSRADVLMPPPPTCPEGARGRTSHAGPHCAPWTCDQGCGEGKACKAAALCVVQRQGANRARRFTFDVVRGPCEAGGKCAEGTCETREVCVAAAPVAPQAGPDAATVVAPETPAAVEPVPAAAPDAQVLEDKKLGTETRKPAACSSGAGETAFALAFPVAWLALLALKRRRQQT